MDDTLRAGDGIAGAPAIGKSDKLLPLLLIPAILVLDQVTKALIVANLPLNRAVEVLGDFLRFWHKRNTAISFSMGWRLPVEVQRVLFLCLSLAVVAAVLVYYLRARDLTRLQRWLLAGIMAGGLGNDIDRIFRGSVVDFVDVKFYGILGMERFATFNVADSTVVVAGILFVVTAIVQESRSKR
jgi:signal peptidase II